MLFDNKKIKINSNNLNLTNMKNLKENVEMREYAFFQKVNDHEENLFLMSANLEEPEDRKIVEWILGKTFSPQNFSCSSFFPSEHNKELVFIGPQAKFLPPWSEIAFNILSDCGIKVEKVVHIKCFLIEKEKKEEFIKQNCDPALELVYAPNYLFKALWGNQVAPRPTYTVPVLEEGVEALEKINKELGIGLDASDMNYYVELFTKAKRNPTNVEIFFLGQTNSEHCRHPLFNGKIIIDGEVMPLTLMELIKKTLNEAANSKFSNLIAYHDNSSAILGAKTHVLMLYPKNPGQASPLELKKVPLHLTAKAETHNFPSTVAPFPGAETGEGGMTRDIIATGIGGLLTAVGAGVAVGNLYIPGYPLPWEDPSFTYPKSISTGLEVLIKGTDGYSDYGNKYGKPLILGFNRSFGLRLPQGRIEYQKVILWVYGSGQIDLRHIKKETAKKGMKIIQIGGPAYNIGLGGGGASSVGQGENSSTLDMKAVQRGNGAMGRVIDNIIRACVELEKNNPIKAIHDQGAGGPGNVLTELIAPVGGYINIGNIVLGDKTMSDLEIWSAEYQERLALLLEKDGLEIFKKICKREDGSLEELGEIDEQRRLVVVNKEGQKIVDLDLKQILEKKPQKTFSFQTKTRALQALSIPEEKIGDMIKKVLSVLGVGSKAYLVNKVDRSVGGLVVQQQCVGPYQIPVADMAIEKQSYFDEVGEVSAIGEQPTVGLVNHQAGIRMSIAEAYTNLNCALYTKNSDIKMLANWMGSPKLEDEGARFYQAVKAASDFSLEIGVPINGGKDSSSMHTLNPEDETKIVKSPCTLVVTMYAPMGNTKKFVTPDIKKPGESKLLLIDPSGGKKRLGGSALANVYKQIGDEAPDIDNPKTLVKGGEAMQKFIDKNLILSAHDISDGGFITTITEMLLAGKGGIDLILNLKTSHNNHDDKSHLIHHNCSLIEFLFSQEAGWVIEYLPQKEKQIKNILYGLNVPFEEIGVTDVHNNLNIHLAEKNQSPKQVEHFDRSLLRKWFEATSNALEKIQIKDLAKALEQEVYQLQTRGLHYHSTFTPSLTPKFILNKKDKIKAAIVRGKGSNGEREMAAWFYAAGFEPCDVLIKDLAETDLDLKQFRVAAFVGGFSYSDTFGSAKGWAANILFNQKVKNKIDAF